MTAGEDGDMVSALMLMVADNRGPCDAGPCARCARPIVGPDYYRYREPGDLGGDNYHPACWTEAGAKELLAEAARVATHASEEAITRELGAAPPAPAPKRVYTRAEVMRRASIAWERVMGNGTTAHEMFLASMKRALEPVDAEVLSSCPFCGGAALEIRDGLGTSRCYVWCRTCGVDGPSEITEEAAKHSWNRRP